MMKRNLLLTFFLLGVSWCNGARILAIFPFELKSQFEVLRPVVKELSNKGHQVDVINTIPVCESLPNCTSILTLPLTKIAEKIKYKSDRRHADDYLWLRKINSKVCDLLGHPVISELIRNPPTDPPYDLLIVHILSGYQCMTAIGILWNIPIVGVITTMPYPQMQHYINNPLNLAVMSRHYHSYEETMNFWERIYNVVMTHYYITHHYKGADIQDYYIKKYVGANMPSYSEIEKSYSLILSNSHYLYHGVKPQVPALIEIGGINVKTEEEVGSKWDPKLKKLLDESKDGFILFSFGSLMAIETIEPKILEIFFETIRKISPIKVILRSANPDALPKNLPSNVFTFSWLPQQKILNHSNIKAFVTHGGNSGTQEAIYYKVPMICVPFFAEQRINCDILKIKNISLKLDIETDKQEDYDRIFDQILTNPLYKRSIDKFSALYWDRPLSPREAVTYWIDFVIRHGKDVLKPQGHHLKWWQVELLDVYAFLLACTLTVLLFLVCVIRLLIKYFIQRLNMGIEVNSSKKVK